MPEQENVRPGVVVATHFVMPHHARYQGYINYLDRDEATRTENADKYDLFVSDYMDNPHKTRRVQLSDPDQPLPSADDEKQSDLFTAGQDQLTAADKQAIKEQFQTAQKNGSPLWQTVISFDNDYLKECGALSPDGRELDERILRTATRNAMREYLRREKMEVSGVWAASIHYNTDNIHIHVATVEPHPTRPKIQYGGREQVRGKIKQSTIDVVKSRVVNTISDDTLHLAEINQVIRENIVAAKRDRPLSDNELFRREYKRIFRQLPADRRRWHYGDHALDGVREQIDQFSARYIARYNGEDLAALNRLLDEQQARLMRAYGTGKNNRYADYKDTKLADLRQRLGNAILTEMREDAKRADAVQARTANKAVARARTQKLLNDSCRDLKKAFKKTFDSVKNQRDFERMQQNIAADVEME